MPLFQRFHREQNEAHGTNYLLPELFDANGEFARNIAMAFIVESDGIPVQGFYFELVPEVCFAGCDASATAFARREIDRIAFALRNMGYQGIACKVPDELAAVIGKPLEKAGFEPDHGLSHFFKDLRIPAAAGEE
jgi:hypothetical protein